MPYADDVSKILNLYLDRLSRYERAEFLLLSNEWDKIKNSLETDIRKLSELDNLTKNQLFNLSLYTRYKQQVELLTNEYAQIAQGIISSGQTTYALAGLESSQLMISLVNPTFNRLNINAANLAIGATSDGTPLYDILIKRYGENATRAASTLVEATARGWNPLKTAREIGADLDGNLYNTLRITRTEQILTMREAQRQQYIQSGIVKGVQLITEPDACPICLGLANKTYPVDWVPDTHPNCRCGIAPVL